ncbi:MAG TPA: hypothetical protein VMO26_23225 [Vicinamibacterales bacterium]|nr:hypothetical protein [Vicinamibacterales bacterium]
MRRLVIGFTCAALAVLTLAPTPQAQAPAAGYTTLEATEANAATTFWTPERFASATPLDLPLALSTVEEAPAIGDPVSSPASAPRGGGGEVNELLFNPAGEDEIVMDGVQPENRGTFLADYTSTRVIPRKAEKKYPWKPTGRLFFRNLSGNTSWCSASAIGKRIVATAGHCVSNGNGSFYSNWVFVPAYRSGVAPFGNWSWSTVIVTNTWHTGGGGVPNAADYAMIIVPDRLIGKRMRRVGDYLGHYGWQTLSLSANHTTQLGYPGNFDLGSIQHQITSGAFRNTSPNNVEYGSDSRGGSSGGPWIQNFSELASGQAGIGLNPGRNRVVAVTSYGYISTDPKVQGASIPDQRWVDLWNFVCNAGAGNC